MKAQIISKWVAPDSQGTTMTARSWHAAVMDDYRPQKMLDATNQDSKMFPSKVPILVVEGEWDDDVFAKLQADPNYTVLWIENDKHTAPDITAVQAALAKQGADATDMNKAIKSDAATKDELASSLNDWIKTQPKGVK